MAKSWHLYLSELFFSLKYVKWAYAIIACNLIMAVEEIKCAILCV